MLFRSYRTYDDYATDDERAYIEFCLRDAYQFYGYDLHYYDGSPVDEDQIKQWMKGFTNVNEKIDVSWRKNVLPEAVIAINGESITEKDLLEDSKRTFLEKKKAEMDAVRLKVATRLLNGLYFINKNGQPLRMMPRLELDPALLSQPLYH